MTTISHFNSAISFEYIETYAKYMLFVSFRFFVYLNFNEFDCINLSLKTQQTPDTWLKIIDQMDRPNNTQFTPHDVPDT